MVDPRCCFSTSIFHISGYRRQNFKNIHLGLIIGAGLVFIWNRSDERQLSVVSKEKYIKDKASPKEMIFL